MKAAVFDTNGGPEVLRYADVDDPKCPPGWVLVEVRSVSVEGGDLLHRQGATAPPHPAYVVGYAAAGNVVEVGEGVEGVAVGQLVTTMFRDGSHVELRAVPAALAWPVPDGVDAGAAAATPVGFATADECLFHRGGLRAGETVLVQGAAGGVGTAAIQLAKGAGATVIVTASSPQRLDRLAGMGADHGIDYLTEDVAARVMELTGGRGADLVVDPVGTTLQSSIAATKENGRVVLVGDAGRGPITADLRRVLMGNQSILGVQMGAEILTERMHAAVADLLDRLAAGKFEVIIDRTFPLSEAAAAHAYIESRQAVGRVLLIP